MDNYPKDLGVFFNSDEFATLARWRGQTIEGLLGHTHCVDQGVETRTTTFTCPSSILEGVAHGELLQCEGDVLYCVRGIFPDGAGLTCFVLEFA